MARTTSARARGTAIVTATLLAITLLTTGSSPARAATEGFVTDPDGDVLGPEGDTVGDASGVDIVELRADLSSSITAELDFAGAVNLAETFVVLLMISPYGGGSTVVFVTSSSDFFDSEGGTTVTATNADGSFSLCEGSTVDGDGTSTLSISLLPTCGNPPNLANVTAFAFANSGTYQIDLVNELLLLDTFGSGQHTRTGLYDGDPATTEASPFTSPVDAAVAGSQALFPDGAFGGVVLARQDLFADALAGSALLNVRGPMLFTDRDAMPEATRTELDRLLEPDDPVLILGGPEAVSDAVLDEIGELGYQPRRLHGGGRVATSMAVAEEVAGSAFGNDVIFARAVGPTSDPNGVAAWVDSIAIAPYAAATATPLVLVGEVLSDAHRQFLETTGIENVILLGGRGAIPEAVEADLIGAGYEVERVAGDGRAATAVAAARFSYEPEPDPAVIVDPVTRGGPHRVAVLNGSAPDAWSYALAAALPAATERTPFILVGDTAIPEPSTVALRSCADAPRIDTWVLGHTDHVPAAVRDQIDALDPEDGCVAPDGGAEDSGQSTSSAGTGATRATLDQTRRTPGLPADLVAMLDEIVAHPVLR